MRGGWKGLFEGGEGVELFLRSVAKAFPSNCATTGTDPGKAGAQQKQPSVATSDFEWRSGWDSSEAMLVISIFGAASVTICASLPSSHIPMQHGMRYARSASVETRKNTTMPRSMYSLITSLLACIRSLTVPQAIIAINPASSLNVRLSYLAYDLFLIQGTAVPSCACRYLLGSPKA